MIERDAKFPVLHLTDQSSIWRMSSLTSTAIEFRWKEFVAFIDWLREIYRHHTPPPIPACVFQHPWLIHALAAKQTTWELIAEGEESEQPEKAGAWWREMNALLADPLVAECRSHHGKHIPEGEIDPVAVLSPEEQLAAYVRLRQQTEVEDGDDK